MTPGKVIAAVVGSIFALVSIGAVVGGGAVLWAYGTQRDDDGFLTSPDYRLETGGYAIASEEVDLTPSPGDWFPAGIADVRIAVDGQGAVPVFVGIAPSRDVDAYLTDVAHERIDRLGFDASDVRMSSVEGGAPSSPPGDEDFWVVFGSGDSTGVTWEVEPGAWSVVVMNADGSAGIDVVVEGGARIGLLLAVGVIVVLFGLLMGGLAAGLLVFATGTGRGRAEAGAVPSVTPAAGGYPAVLEGDLDPDLSRWMWLVKWFLAIPHMIVLGLLYAAFTVLSIVAFFSILFTGRYPRAIFDFNVGVLRWTWRVSFYAFSAIGTDRYPPFTLQDADYPARFDVAYPERLSQGLVLVKWWLLAIPHYIIVGLLTSGLVWWSTELGGGDTFLEFGGGVIGLLVLVAGIVLLFTGRYPEPLFELVMGLNRWVYRVIAYVALMRDEYPPFRLDVGGTERPADEATGAATNTRP